ncbi:type II toxin-antitoxin system RelE family toxin [Pseudomonas sp. LRF_L74]|uniref:type II toxin-antitoxin system RelE family toxin n=1 Tax=Pseudomonas sp. LRF_L74 TaxID=3369422 RepID=UPI003F5E51F2
MNRIEWARKAVKQLGRLDRADQVRIYETVQVLTYMPNVQNVRSLTRHRYGYRLRIGNYRVMFDWDGSVKIVNIEEVKKRDEHTYQ